MGVSEFNLRVNKLLHETNGKPLANAVLAKSRRFMKSICF
jgi:hypothetical protein